MQISGDSLTNRQELILETLIDEYIKNAFPISSDFLKHECSLDVSPATIRIDLAKLTTEGFLEKFHISGGRIPTDRGYRFFVDKIIDRAEQNKQKKKKIQGLNDLGDVLKNFEKSFNAFQKAAKSLAVSSSNLGVIFNEQDMFLKEGWDEIIKAPEFEDTNLFKEFAGLVSHFEKQAKDIIFDKNEKIKVFIGQESPFEEKDFSIILARPACNEHLTFALLGPKRMNFKRNISLLDALIDVLEN